MVKTYQGCRDCGSDPCYCPTDALYRFKQRNRDVSTFIMHPVRWGMVTGVVFMVLLSVLWLLSKG